MPLGRKQKAILLVLTLFWVLITVVRIWSVSSYSARKPAVGEETGTIERALYFNILYPGYSENYRELITQVNSMVISQFNQLYADKKDDPGIQARTIIVKYAVGYSSELDKKDGKLPADDKESALYASYKKFLDNPTATTDLKEILKAVYFTSGSSLSAGYDKDNLEKSIKRTFDYSLIGWSDVSDWQGLIRKLKGQQSSIDKRLRSFLSKSAVEAVDKWKPGVEPDDAVKALILADLNNILDNSSFFDRDAFGKTPMVQEAHNLYDKGVKNLADDKLRRFNRLLLEAAYPSEFAQSRKGSAWFRDYTLYRLYTLTGNTNGQAEITARANLFAKKLTVGAILLCIILVAGFSGLLLLVVLPAVSYFVCPGLSLTARHIGSKDNAEFSGFCLWKAWLAFIGWELMRFFAALNMSFIASRHTGVPIYIIFAVHMGVYAIVLLFAFRVFSDKIFPATDKGETAETPEASGESEAQLSDDMQPAQKAKPWSFSLDLIGINNPAGMKNLYGILTGIAGYCCAIPLVIVGSYLYKLVIGTFPRSQNAALDIIGNISNLSDGIMIFLMVGIVGPIFEEILFRGYLYTTVRRYLPAYVSVLLVSFVFAAVHFDFNVFIGLFTLGAILAVLYERTGSLVPAMITHILWNSMTFFLTITLVK